MCSLNQVSSNYKVAPAGVALVFTYLDMEEICHIKYTKTFFI